MPPLSQPGLGFGLRQSAFPLVRPRQSTQSAGKAVSPRGGRKAAKRSFWAAKRCFWPPTGHFLGWCLGPKIASSRSRGRKFFRALGLRPRPRSASELLSLLLPARPRTAHPTEGQVQFPRGKNETGKVVSLAQTPGKAVFLGTVLSAKSLAKQLSQNPNPSPATRAPALNHGG